MLNGRRVQCCHCNTDRHLPKICEHLRTRALDGVQLVDGQYRAIEPWDASDKDEVREHISNNRFFLKHWDSYDIDGDRHNERLREAKHREVEHDFEENSQIVTHNFTATRSTLTTNISGQQSYSQAISSNNKQKFKIIYKGRDKGPTV